MIRNIAIVAHVDHGKTTLVDGLLRQSGTLGTHGDHTDRVMDQNDQERERGITIKSQTARIEYTAQDGETYVLNLIDTPGHVDFTYEVSRALSACEGALLVVDAAQGVQAQTVANVYLAIENDLEIIPVLNKIDLPQADPDEVINEIEEGIGIDCTNAVHVSAKAGLGIEEALEAIVTQIPPPSGDPDKPLRALLVDSWYDNYRGAVILVRVREGQLSVGQKIQMMSSKREFEVQELGYFTPKATKTNSIKAGDVGYVIAGIKDVRETPVGDTVTLAKDPYLTSDFQYYLLLYLSL